MWSASLLSSLCAQLHCRTGRSERCALKVCVSILARSLLSIIDYWYWFHSILVYLFPVHPVKQFSDSTRNIESLNLYCARIRLFFFFSFLYMRAHLSSKNKTCGMELEIPNGNSGQYLPHWSSSFWQSSRPSLIYNTPHVRTNKEKNVGLRQKIFRFIKHLYNSQCAISFSKPKINLELSAWGSALYPVL